MATTLLARSDIAAFPKWTGMLGRYDAALQENAACPSASAPCPLRDWRDFVKTLEKLDFRARLAAVNARINALPYVADRRNWEVEDYWETPFELFAKGGDCEDFAIAKYLALKETGVDPRRMRIVIVEDMERREPHALLAVEAKGTVLLLDNQTARIAVSSRRYRALYSINEYGWWLHTLPRPDLSS
jgi:predicted transglutaminase-like cysteine proteinase